MAWLLVSVLVLNVLVSGQLFVSGITVTSSRSIEEFLNLDLSGNLEKYIAHEGIRLKIIADDSRYEEEVPFVKERLQEFKSIQQEIIKNKTANAILEETALDNHPTSVLAVIRNFVYAWEEKLSNTTKYGLRLEEFLKRDLPKTASFPTRDDLYRASAVITFLQKVYDVSKDDIVKGNIKGHQGAPLNAADCHYIGKVSMASKMLDDAEDWMRMALKSVDLSSDDVNKVATFNVTDAMATLARVLFTKEERQEALELLERATDIDPDNMYLHNMFLAHRYGKKVTPVEPMDVDPVRKDFFEMCGNLSAQTSIGSRINEPLVPRCRYKSNAHTPYWRYREEIVSTYPFISVIHDFFIGDTDIDTVLEASNERAFREDPLPGGRSGQLWQSKIRTTMDFFKPIIKDVSRRVGYVTGLGIRQKKGRLCLGEPVHFIDFGPGGTYSPHRDAHKLYLPTYMGIDQGARKTTFHLYLTDIKEGGHLVFPEIRLAIEPKKGMAVIINNYKPSGIPEPNLLVGMCPVLVGQAKVLQKGVFSSGLDANVLCGRKPLSTHYSVEKARKCIAGPCGAPNTYKK